MAVIIMPKVLSCSVKECAYNTNDKCHALAITVGDVNHPACDAFFKAETKGGVLEITGGVGSCKIGGCKFNRAFGCSATGISVGPHSGHADCRTFTQK